MREFIKQRLLEAIKSKHWKEESYPTRIDKSTFQELGPEAKKIVDDRIKFIESLEFSEAKPQKIGIWIYKAPVEIKHPPFEKRDKGSLLLGIINNNNMSTLYWKHIMEGQYDFDITYDDLVEFTKSPFYDAKTKPISISSIQQWVKSKTPKVVIPQNTNKFKKIKLNNGEIIKYYELLNKFETLNNEPITLDNIFDKLPEEIQSKVIDLMEGKNNFEM